MGQIALAAKVTHVPSLLLSEREGTLKGRRALAIESLKEIGKRVRDRHADTFLIFDTHWLSNFGFHINANERHAGSYTSHEAPHMIQDLTYDYSGNPALADLIADQAASNGLEVHAHRIQSLGARIWKYRSNAIHECRWCAQSSARGVAAFRQYR
jgi:3,4-dihydroxyphenylacetate 2,3-dioxygenase